MALTDPRGWGYQAAVHGRTGAAPVGVVWNECQHGSWHFLPWHRAYLYYFEEIVRAEVISQGGPADWALPYWNYAIPGRDVLPPAFREPTLPDGTPNPLFLTQRNPGINTGSPLPSTSTSAAAALAHSSFTPPPAPTLEPPAPPCPATFASDPAGRVPTTDPAAAATPAPRDSPAVTTLLT